MRDFGMQLARGGAEAVGQRHEHIVMLHPGDVFQPCQCRILEFQSAVHIADIVAIGKHDQAFQRNFQPPDLLGDIIDGILGVGPVPDIADMLFRDTFDITPAIECAAPKHQDEQHSEIKIATVQALKTGQGTIEPVHEGGHQ